MGFGGLKCLNLQDKAVQGQLHSLARAPSSGRTSQGKLAVIKRRFLTFFMIFKSENKMRVSTTYGTVKIVRVGISMFHRAFFNSIIDEYQPTHALFHIQHCISLEC